MKRSEELDRLSLDLMGIAIGLFIGGAMLLLGLPGWALTVGALVVFVASSMVYLRSVAAQEEEIAEGTNGKA